MYQRVGVPWLPRFYPEAQRLATFDCKNYSPRPLTPVFIGAIMVMFNLDEREFYAGPLDETKFSYFHKKLFDYDFIRIIWDTVPILFDYSQDWSDEAAWKTYVSFYVPACGETKTLDIMDGQQKQKWKCICFKNNAPYFIWNKRSKALATQ